MSNCGAIKIVHVEGGLGNQMAAYSVYVAVKEMHPQDRIFIDTYLYDVTDAHGTISMWNGYELKKVFGIDIPDIRSLFSSEQIMEQIEYLRASEFWKHDWNYSEVFIEMMKKYGIDLVNAYGHVGEQKKNAISTVKYLLKRYNAKAASNAFSYRMKHIAYKIYRRISADPGAYLIQVREGNYYYDITLDFMKSPLLCQRIGGKVREGLQFIEPLDPVNQEIINRVQGCNSVSIHIRRSDYLPFNEDCYQYGYFPKCVSYIKKVTDSPVFFIFSDDMHWCRSHLSEIGLSATDRFYFVDVNTGDQSYRDMQIMSRCKHNIATKSSFGWWGGFLNDYKNKITCCQIGSYVCTNQF